MVIKPRNPLDCGYIQTGKHTYVHPDMPRVTIHTDYCTATSAETEKIHRGLANCLLIAGAKIKMSKMGYSKDELRTIDDIVMNRVKLIPIEKK